MIQITLAEYEAISKNYRSVWDTERTDWKDWAEVRHKYMGKRTMMKWVQGFGTCLLVEGQDFEIVG